MNYDLFNNLAVLYKDFMKNFINDDGSLTELGWYCILLGVSLEIKERKENKNK